jgi:hypothetical protein
MTSARTNSGFASTCRWCCGSKSPPPFFTDNGNRTATLAGTPAAGAAGLYPLTFTASNGVLPNATQSFNLLVAKARIYLPLVVR